MTERIVDSRTLLSRAFPPDAQWPKKALRQWMKKKRSTLDPRAAQYKNLRITEQCIQRPELKASACVALYSALPDEVQTRAIAAYCLSQGKKVVYPIVRDQAIEFRTVKHLENDLIHRGSFGILEPNPDRCDRVPYDAIDLFLLPGVAFDLFGSRVGFGGGYYDRVLARARPDSNRIALAFDFQIVHALQTEPHDGPVHFVISEEAVYSPHLSVHRSNSESDTKQWAKQLLNGGNDKKQVFALHADLGVGKTVFVQGLAEGLGTEKGVISPTFLYCREYNGKVPLLHVDAYRLENVKGQEEPFWDEILDQRGIVAVEWAERLGDQLPKSAIHCFGEIRDDNSREWILFTPLDNQKSLHSQVIKVLC